MARAVRAGQPLGVVGDDLVFKSMPELSNMALNAYEQVFPDRLARFRQSPNKHFVEIKASADPSSWRHELRHDAESAFWLLVWWVVNASPQNGTMTKIPNGVWGPLVDTRVDVRTCKLPATALDPVYSPLGVLLNQLGDAVLHDFHWATDKPYTDPEFLHEAFQRHILNFVFANQNAGFMNLPKGDTLRKPEKITEIPSLSTSQIDSLRTHSSAKGLRDP